MTVFENQKKMSHFNFHVEILKKCQDFLIAIFSAKIHFFRQNTQKMSGFFNVDF